MLGNKLKYGDTIGVIAPASPEDRSVIEEKLTVLKELGFKIKAGKHLYDHKGFLAGDDIHRAEDLMSLFYASDIKMVLCFRGGYGTMRLLPHLDLDVIKSNPKIFMGFSDITVLLNIFYQKLGLITFHGPMVNSDLKDSTTLNSMLTTLMEGDRPYNIYNPPDTPLNYINFKDSVEGRIVGGNLALICSTLGTKYEINTDNKILFLEDVDEPPYKVDRMLTQLILSGKLHRCKAILLGQFTDCTLPHYERSLTLEEVIKDRIYNLGVPTCSNFMSGHGSPKLTLPIGAKVALDPNSNGIRVLEKVVK
ncbi:S66 peptidase family protein [Clostridium thermarum]|uniref:S66 peptidase family protein n=1 Tax=Clostridium thermarum TaxID=1716543 RepID=UPI0011214C5D|nr:LD-carboxypeptidase [Clostridium thermarum]